MFIHISQLGEPLVIGCTENQSGVGKVTHRFKHWINVAYSLCHMHCDHAFNFGERFMCFSLKRDDCDVATGVHGFWFCFGLKLI